MNADIVVSAGVAANFVSNSMLDDNTLSTVSGQLKIIGPSTNIDNNEIGSGYLNWVVMINEHIYNSATAGI
jgi:5-methylthioribose kinase